MESELFGYEKGSFTGALKEGKQGRFEQADKGTIFIDEINQMPLSIQPKLLRVLQEKEVDRIGSNTSIPVDVRVIAATNEDLKDMVRQGRFRGDLFYRLQVIEIRIPPLRERLEDLEELILHIIDELNVSLGLSISGVAPEAVQTMKGYHWPGNIRELHNVVERAMNYAKSPILQPEDFRIGESRGEGGIMEFVSSHPSENPIELVRNKAERLLIISTLEKFGNNKTKAAEYLQIARPLLYQKMKRLGIE